MGVRIPKNNRFEKLLELQIEIEVKITYDETPWRRDPNDPR
jgi:hypothetical protein